MPRHRAEFGSRKKVGRDVWNHRWWQDLRDGRGYRRQFERFHGTATESKERMRQIREQVASERHGRANARPQATVRQAYESWFAPKDEARCLSGDLSRHTVQQHQSMWRLHVEPTWGDVPCGDVKLLGINEWLAGMTHSTAKQSAQLLSMTLDQAVIHDVIDANPMMGPVEYPSTSTSERRDTETYTMEQTRLIWRQAWGKWWEPAFLLVAYAGARIGESLGPMADSVYAMDVDGRLVAAIPLTRQVANGGGVSERLKNAQSVRTAVMTGPMGERLLEIANARQGDWLTGIIEGQHVTQAKLTKAYREAVEAAGLPYHPMKNLRAAWETQANWGLKLEPRHIEPMMGHIAPGSRVTALHYDRPMAEEFARTLASAYAKNSFAEGWPWA